MGYELLLINISRDIGGYSASFRDSIGQYLIAAYLREYEYKAYVFSGNIAECKKIIEREISNSHVPVIGFYAAADNIRVVKHAIYWIKANYPNVKTVIGGPQAIDLDYNFFLETKNDFAIVGEGEIPMRFLLAALIDGTIELSSVPSLVSMSDEGKNLIINQCDNAIISDLDTLPHPSIEDSLVGNLRKGTIVGIITGRGCPYQCTFCYEGANAKNVRFRSVENVMREIDYILSINRNIQYISIYDDTFTLKKERVLEFCTRISEKNLMWFCEGHISFVLNHPDILLTMVKSGLSCIQFGIESGSNLVLDAYNKHTNYDMILEAIKICKASGVHGITGNFIIGGAFESAETLEKSKQLAKELIFSAKGIIELYVVYFAPYPNTRIVNCPENFDIILQPDLQNYNLNSMRSPVVSTKELSTKEIYDAKRDFEIFIQNTYKEAASSPMKKDLVQGLFHKKSRIHINPTWERYYMLQPYLVTFLEHMSDEEQIFSPYKYIIRTFEDIVLEEDKLLSEVGEFYGKEKDILLNATGIYTAEEMACHIGITLNELEEIYTILNDKCLVYMSEF